jgi:hypothetical protein
MAFGNQQTNHHPLEKVFPERRPEWTQHSQPGPKPLDSRRRNLESTWTDKSASRTLNR